MPELLRFERVGRYVVRGEECTPVLDGIVGSVARWTAEPALLSGRWASRQQSFHRTGYRTAYLTAVADPDGTVCVWSDSQPLINRRDRRTFTDTELGHATSLYPAHAAAVAAGRVYLRVAMPDMLRALLHDPDTARVYLIDDAGFPADSVPRFRNRQELVTWVLQKSIS